MADPIVVRTVARTAVVGSWVLLVAVVGRPIWLAVLLGLVLVGVWASPFLSATNRRIAGTTAGPELSAVEPREAGPG
jgi:hypothetical protein